MKRLTSALLAITASTSLNAQFQASGADVSRFCEVTKVVDHFVSASCPEVITEKHLYDGEGKKYEIINSYETNYIFNDYSESLRVGDRVSANQFLEQKEIEVQGEIRNPSKPKLRMMREDIVEGDYKLDLYLSIFGFEGTNIKTDGSKEIPKLSITNGTVATAPIDLMADFKFENVVLSIQPDFDLGGGEVAIYGNLDRVWAGFFVDYKRDKNENITEVNNKAETTTEIVTSLFTGIGLRVYNDVENWSSLTHAKLGYFSNKNEEAESSVGSSSIVFEAGYFEVGSLIHYKVNNKFLVGLGFDIAYGAGNITTNILTDQVVDNLRIFRFTLTPINIKASF